jgi:hypothetical protein
MSEYDTKKILKFRESMEQRVQELQAEIHDLQKAMEELDKLIVNTGFRTFTTEDSQQSEEKTEDVTKPVSKDVIEPVTEDATKNVTEVVEEVESEEEQISITSKDGTVLGTMNVQDHTIIFTPSTSFDFNLDIPPLQSFLIERVLDNMRKTDQERSTNGELDPGEILEYKVQEEDGKLTQLSIHNYGGERRLREINSSLRWTFDKMYDKITQG